MFNESFIFISGVNQQLESSGLHLLEEFVIADM